ncbi:hypothetical protein B0T24DRAFT_652288 [Lasiosphaeria ovina]|uniref:HNH nuclease domain-containing protein n=1 Tax=Lasiosphaeria ovina TaxID=92902 RepID=A0AAE0JW73_9PEZI|nr:hypothetical protein B0T24DRAFT_652288 [Lasiosphaeria ovina]
MFDMGVAYLTEGLKIDRPRNAMTLTPTIHQQFGDFQIYFEQLAAAPGQQDPPPHTYRVGSFLPPQIFRRNPLPPTRTLHLSENRTIEPPSPRLLALHCAIAHILHLSAAGAYINRILQDVEEHGIRADGSTNLGRLVALGLNQWTCGIARHPTATHRDLQSNDFQGKRNGGI